MEDTNPDFSEFFDPQTDDFAHEFIASGKARHDGRMRQDTDELPLTVRQNLARIQRRYSDRFNITTENVLAELAKCAFFDPKDLFTPEGRLKPFHEIDSQTSAAIAGMKITQVGGSDQGWVEQIHYKFADKLKALEKLGQHLGLFKDNITTPTGNQDTTIVSGNERGRRMAFVLERLLLERARNSAGGVAPQQGN